MQLTSSPAPLIQMSAATSPAFSHVSLEMPLTSSIHWTYSSGTSSILGSLDAFKIGSSIRTTLLFDVGTKSEFIQSSWSKLTLPFASQWWHKKRACLSLTLTDKVLWVFFFLSGPHSGQTALISLPDGSFDADVVINFAILSNANSLDLLSFGGHRFHCLSALRRDRTSGGAIDLIHSLKYFLNPVIIPSADIAEQNKAGGTYPFAD